MPADAAARLSVAGQSLRDLLDELPQQAQVLVLHVSRDPVRAERLNGALPLNDRLARGEEEALLDDEEEAGVPP